MSPTAHFSPATDPHLYRCGCGRPSCDAPPPTRELLAALELLRVRLGRPVIVTSGPRCGYWNAHEGGEIDSGHLDGSEADVAAEDSRQRDEVLAAVYATPRLFLRVGIGRTFVHLGTSSRLDQRVAWLYA